MFEAFGVRSPDEVIACLAGRATREETAFDESLIALVFRLGLRRCASLSSTDALHAKT